jgi:uncharacterized protein YrzB (UPF0473 family)
LSKEFEDKLIEEFSKLDSQKISVILSKQHIFLCGGPVDATCFIPPSFRDRFVSYTANKDHHMHKALVLAENFKDYFKDNIYSDLLVFEDEIANLSTLVVIFLESPGSFVELGMFCSKPHFYKKLVIVAPEQEVHKEDSFIYLGPIENIRKKDKSSVVILPWPDEKRNEYDESFLITLLNDINEKIKSNSSRNKSGKFDSNNSGHNALLICEIVRLCYPILISEIELALEALSISMSANDISRHLYLLSKFKLIDKYFYSGYKYYFPINIDEQKIKFSSVTCGQFVDPKNIRMSIIQSFVTLRDSLSIKRTSAQKQIMENLKGNNP